MPAVMATSNQRPLASFDPSHSVYLYVLTDLSGHLSYAASGQYINFS